MELIGADNMASFFALVILFVILMVIGIPVITIAVIATIAAVLVLLLWTGVELFKLFFYLALTWLISGAVGKIANHFGLEAKMAKNLSLVSAIGCIYYFFFK